MKYTEKTVSYPLGEDIIKRGMVEKPFIGFNENNPLFMKDLAIVDEHMKKIRANNMKRTIVINNSNPGFGILAICM